MAAPNPEREFERLEKVLASAASPQVFLIHGVSRWFRGRALDLLRHAFEAGSDLIEVDARVTGSRDEDLSLFLMDLRTQNLFAGRKVLLLRNGETWLSFLAPSLTGIAKGNVLVIDVDKMDGRTKLARQLKSMGGVFEFRNLYDRPFRDEAPRDSAEIVLWIVDRARKKKIGLSPDAALFMLEVVGSEPALLEGELERLAPIFEHKNVQASELRSQLSISFGSSQFEFVDALLGQDLRAALRSLSALYREGLRTKDGQKLEASAVFPMLCSWLDMCLAKLSEAMFCLESGESMAEVVARYGGFFKDRFEKQLRSLDLPCLARMHDALLRAERRLRVSAEEPQILLERMLLEALAKTRVHLTEAAEEAL